MKLFRAPGVYWAIGSIADSWYGFPVRVPVGLVRAVGLARGGSFVLDDPQGRVETLSGASLSHAENYYLFCMVRNVDGLRCGFSDYRDSIGSRAQEASLRVRVLLGFYLQELLGMPEYEVRERASEIMTQSLLLVSSIRGMSPVSCKMSVGGGDVVLHMTVRLDGVLEDIDVVVGGSGE